MRVSTSMAILVASMSVIVLSGAADAPVVRAPLQPRAARKLAAPFQLDDAAGKTMKLSDYQGRVLLLNFWATWCGGCKREIPWFQQFQTDLLPQGLAVLGVSMDETGWAAVTPYLQKAPVGYRIAVADRLTSERYEVKSLPATYIIDRKGRIAATYIGLVDRNNVEANLKTVLNEDSDQ